MGVSRTLDRIWIVVYFVVMHEGRILTLVSLVLSVVFAGMLEFLTRPWERFWFLFFLFFILLSCSVIAVLWNEVRTRSVDVLIMPLSYIAGVFLFHLFIPQGIFQYVFMVLATVGFYFLIARGVDWAYPTWNWFFTSVTFFLFVSAVYGLYFHLRFPLWIVVLSVSIMTASLSLHVLSRSDISLAERIFWSILLAFVISEILGAFALLPLSYFAVSGSLFVIFYICLHLLQKHIYEQLTAKIVAEYLVFGALAVSLILGTAQWAIV